MDVKTLGLEGSQLSGLSSSIALDRRNDDGDPRRTRTPAASTLAEELTGWGRYPSAVAEEYRSEDLDQLTIHAPLTRGAGRAYGDAALPSRGDRRVVNSTLANRILGFDPESGVLTAEAGLSLDDIYRTFLPRGYFTPVSPGTRYVTLGGMVAADVHGKNHHCDGTIGRYVECLLMRVGTGDIVEASPTVNSDLFRATLGGMGLTGHILEVTLRLKQVTSPWIVAERERIPDIGSFVAALKRASQSWPMTAGWIDCLSDDHRMGRGVLYRGRWATQEEAPAGFPCLRPPMPVPSAFPEFVLGPLTVRTFNTLNYWRHLPRVRRAVIPPRRFFYPLDVLANWNRIYGRRGFTQYQCVLPSEAGPDAAERFLRVLTRRGGASFLCVIKDCGPEGIGLLSFPRPGISIALDIPIRHDIQSLIDALNELVIDAGGRIYLAKDALTRPADFRRMEARLDQFLDIRRKWDPSGRIRSAQSVRLFGW
jgi:FAD/FMN-containing dehydrogenase